MDTQFFKHFATFFACKPNERAPIFWSPPKEFTYQCLAKGSTSGLSLKTLQNMSACFMYLYAGKECGLLSFIAYGTEIIVHFVQQI